ncbi:MAG: thioredoxin-dependent thiol peroxidase [Bacteroidetes bacterium]|nr:MAG: thioredoxin-dependent thiol peroxidase [Bacteroidota bacterium]
MATELLSVGSEVPDITVKDQDGQPLNLKTDLKGQKFVLFFYPKDNTSTCTKEACNLRDGYAELKARGYEVFGVSPDGEKSHRNFIAKHKLPYRLLSDPETALIQAFGAWGEKKMYGKTYMGLLRTTFVVDEAGMITHVVPKVKAVEHTAQILSLIDA